VERYTSAVDLNPTNLSGITVSAAYGTDGAQQVGFGGGNGTGGYAHAMLWNGTADSAVDLNPTNLSGIVSSVAYGISGTQQVGGGSNSPATVDALLWTGTAASAVDLNPTNLNGINASLAYGICGAQQVGYGYNSTAGNDYQAMLWTGTADSAVDLNGGLMSSEALATNGIQQVGFGYGSETGNADHALLWTGTADSTVDLQAFLPSTAPWFISQADSIDSAGNIYGFANYGLSTFAVEWSPAPTLAWNNAAGTGDGRTWDTYGNQNWNGGGAPAFFHAGDNITFNDTNSDNYAVTLNTTVIASSVTVNNSSSNYIISGTGKIADAGAFVKTGSGTLTLGTALSVGSMSISGGTLQLAANTTLGSGTVTSNVNLMSLSITGNGVLDVNNNHIIITYGSSDPITTIAGYIASGYNGGGWNGPGIISSAAQTSTNGLSYGLGYADGADGVVTGLSSGQIEVAYTLLGDANLDGLVNGSDFNILAANFNQSITGWDQGDFNYDGLVNATDFNELAANFNQGVSGATSAGDVAALDAFAAANGLLVNVPEPTTGSLLLVAGAGLSMRRRRKQLE